MTPEQFLALFAAVQQLLALVEQLNGESDETARETYAYAIQTRAGQILLDLNNTATGLAALQSAIFAVRIDTQEPHAATLTDVLDAIASVPQFELPEIPPPGYGGGDLTEVWLSNFETYDWCTVD
jgi:hypothetical protein